MSEMYDRSHFFATYFSKTTEKKLFLELFRKRFSGASGEALSVLDLGSHDGTLILKVLAEVAPALPRRTQLTAVDPSGPAIEAFRAKPLPAGVTAELHVATAEEFLARSTATFDWTIASHCLYWSDDLTEVVRAICRASRECVIVFRGVRGIREVQSHFRHLLGNKKEHLYTADDIERALREIGAPFEREEHRTEVELPPSDSPEFRWLVGFFLQTSDEALSESDWSEIRAYLEPFGSRLRPDVNFFWIRRSQS